MAESSAGTPTRRRGPGRPFQKGVSGNPGGRPAASAAIRALAQQHGPEAIQGLLRLAQKAESEAARVSAWNSILDRAYGKPTVGEPDDAGQQVGRVVYTWGDETA